MSEKFVIGSIVEGTVVRLKPFGAIVSLDEKTQGLVHISQVANGFVKDINDHLKEGDTVKVKVLSIDEATNKIALSIRDALPPSERPQRTEKPFRSREQKSNYEGKGTRSFDSSRAPSSPHNFEDKMKDWLKESTERQATLSKRSNKRSY